jgi:hypothetical protein
MRSALQLRILAGALAGAFLLAPVVRAPGSCADSMPPALWLYCGAELVKDSEVPRLQALWKRAAAAGYTHVILTDPKFERLGEMNPGYFVNARRVKKLADSLGIELVPALFPIGRSSTLLALNQDLAEAVPVKDALLEVQGGVARVVADPPVALAERPDYADPSVALADGHATIRDHSSRSRISFRQRVAPFRCYHVSVEARTTGYSGSPMVTVYGIDERALTFARSFGLAPTQDWTRLDLVFDSLENDAVSVWMGAWKPGRGTLEWRGWSIEEVGPVNVVHRPGAPFTITDRVEGRDYEPVRDPLLGMVPWRGQYRAWHEAPVIRTALPEGTRLRASWYYAAVLFDHQVSICPCEPATLELLRDEAQRMRMLWGARGYLMMHDEIRVLGWDRSCRSRGATAGAILAAHARDCLQMLAGSRVYVWGDMYDPFQNAVRDYYLVRGDLAGSWEGLDSSVVIVNWNAPRAAESLRFFADRGHHQVIAGYYDGAPQEVRKWIDAARGVPGVEGVMYTTWRDRFDDLEAFANEVRAAWGK